MRKPVCRRAKVVGLLAGMCVVSAALAQDISGAWEGTYSCGQGVTGLSLIVSAPSEDEPQAVFHFYATAQNPAVPEGCFEMSGSYVADTGEVDFAAGRWLLQPGGFVTVGLNGSISRSGTEMTGVVDGPGCGKFRLRRNTVATHPLPARCRPEPETTTTAGATPPPAAPAPVMPPAEDPKGDFLNK